MKTEVDVTEKNGYCGLEFVRCPECKEELVADKGGLKCNRCRTRFPVRKGIYDLRPPDGKVRADAMAWSEHWAPSHQGGLPQRFFSFYRKAVVARTVKYFFDRYFSARGVFIEAGSGTSECSIRVDKLNGARTLIATDIAFEVLESCDPIMDMRVCGTFFKLPLDGDSIDGIWNIGVMEHFSEERIDDALREFHRVLKTGGRIILLWPATYTFPQKLLKFGEWVINLWPRAERYQFHRFPVGEISQLESVEQGVGILERNGFRTVRADAGLRSLMSFITLVGEK